MAADYDLPAVVEKRVRFFDGQYLQDQDFIDEQKYHLDRERRHNRLLHLTGVADGLLVAATGAANTVTVTAGTAIDADGRVLALAGDTAVGLPAERFNGHTNVELYLTYDESPEDRQAEEGIDNYTRWLERPRLVPLAPGERYAGSAPPVLLAMLALDDAGRVVADGGVRQYSGMRLPGPVGDPPTLRAATGGRVRLTAPLTVDGNVGIGTTAPSSDLTVGGFEAQDRYLTLRVQGGNQYRSGLKMWAWQEHFGFSVQFDERHSAGDGLHIRSHDVDPEGVSRVFVGLGGDVGIGTTAPGARLHVNGAGGDNVDLLVSGRLRSNSNGGGLWVSDNRFIGGHSTNQVGFFNNGAWRLTVLNDGRVGVGTTDPKQTLSVNGRLYLENGVIQRGGTTALTSTSDLGLYSHVDSNWIRIVTTRAPVRFFTDGGAGTTARLSIESDGKVGVGTPEARGTLDVNGDIFQHGRKLLGLVGIFIEYRETTTPESAGWTALPNGSIGERSDTVLTLPVPGGPGLGPPNFRFHFYFASARPPANVIT
jgi:hypothetical protein